MWPLKSRGEWERKKNYLVRSLFEDIPTLLTIVEGNESSSPSDFNYRVESPLPELTIEVERKKPNYHDEPEEVYEKLAIEMRYLYRKDFLGINSSSDLEDSSSNSASSTSTNVLKDKYHDYDITEYDIGFLEETDLHNTEKSSESTLIVSETFTTKVEVHSQVRENQEDLAYEQLGFINNKQFIPKSEEDIMDVSNTKIESTESKADASNYFGDSESSVSSSHASPEIMRQRQPFTWLGTPTHSIFSKSNSTISRSIHMSIDVDSEVDEEIITPDQEMEIVQGSPDNETLTTPNSTRKRKPDLFLIERGHKKSLVSSSSSSSSKSVTNVAIQTTFSDSNTDGCCFWSKLFVGSPTVYNVCSCSDHVCTN